MSISDAIFNAQKEIVEYLQNGWLQQGPGRQRVENLLEEMDAVRYLPGFDTHPDRPAPERRSAEQIIASFTSGDTTGVDIDPGAGLPVVPLAKNSKTPIGWSGDGETPANNIPNKPKSPQYPQPKS